jgi:hypothetical protein
MINSRKISESLVPFFFLVLLMHPLIGSADPPPADSRGFCAEVQYLIGATALPSENVVYDDLDAFVKSKATPKPLVTRQFVHYESDDPRLPKMISCKLKSADNLNFEYGAGSAGHEGTCRSVNGLTLERVRAARGKSDSSYGVFTKVELDPDEVGPSGVVWLKPYTMVRVDENNVLHIKSKALYVSWHDERFLKMPARFRGTHYCHLIAPSYLRRLLDGEVAVGPADM